MRRLIILRPEPGSSESLGRARTMGLDAVAHPLFRIAPVLWLAPDSLQFDALLLTSANALRHAGAGLDRLRALPAYAIGEATAAAARDAGLRVEAIGHGDIDDLLHLVPPDLRLLHLCGEHRRNFDAGDRSITQIAVYRSETLPAEGLAGALHGQVAAVHSPRAGARLAELVDGSERHAVRIAAISPAAAQAAGIGWAKIEYAQLPTDEALLALAARLCEESGQQ